MQTSMLSKWVGAKDWVSFEEARWAEAPVEKAKEALGWRFVTLRRSLETDKVRNNIGAVCWKFKPMRNRRKQGGQGGIGNQNPSQRSSVVWEWGWNERGKGILSNVPKAATEKTSAVPLL